MVGVIYYGPIIDSCSICVPLLALQAEQFAWELRLHPHQQQVQFVLDGIRHGFKLGFCPDQKLKAAKKNKPSAHQHQSVIDDYLAEFTLHYITVDQIIRLVSRLGKGALMAKFDVESAYCNVCWG